MQLQSTLGRAFDSAIPTVVLYSVKPEIGYGIPVRLEYQTVRLFQREGVKG